MDEARESYRYYLRAAVWVGVLAGAALGVIHLTWIAVWGYTGVLPQWDWWPALVQAHGNAQLFGWTGLFVMGIALHSLPRMLQRPAPPAWLPPTVFGLVLSGILLGLAAQPLSGMPLPAAAWVLGCALQWAGVSLFAGYMLRTLGRPASPPLGFLLAGTVWFWIGASARLFLAAAAVNAGTMVPSAVGNAAYLHVMGWGFLLAYVLGYSLRLLPAFAGLPQAREAPAWWALRLVTAGAAAEAAALLAGQPVLSFAAVGVLVVGVGFAVAAVRPWSRPLTGDEREAPWLLRYARAAYLSLAAAAVILVTLRVLQAAGPVSSLHAHALGGAARHALTVGFVSLMMVGVAWRILPIFSGAPAPHPSLFPTVFGLLVAGNAMRVGGQIAAGFLGGAWYGVMGLSGYLELFGVTLFALDIVRLLSAAVDTSAVEGDLPEVEVSLEAPVGPLVARRPWLVPVFAGHGMAQVSNRLFQRTVGQRVTVAQACRRFEVEPGAFLRELLEQDHDHTAAAAG